MAAIVCPKCGNRGNSDAGVAFAVRGQYQGRAIRRCLSCGAGLLIGAFSGGLFGKPKVVPPEVWQKMQRTWEQEFGDTDSPEDIDGDELSRLLRRSLGHTVVVELTDGTRVAAELKKMSRPRLPGEVPRIESLVLAELAVGERGPILPSTGGVLGLTFSPSEVERISHVESGEIHFSARPITAGEAPDIVVRLRRLFDKLSPTELSEPETASLLSLSAEESSLVGQELVILKAVAIMWMIEAIDDDETRKECVHDFSAYFHQIGEATGSDLLDRVRSRYEGYREILDGHMKEANEMAALIELGRAFSDSCQAPGSAGLIGLGSSAFSDMVVEAKAELHGLR
jgi:hypothetical protein